MRKVSSRARMRRLRISSWSEVRQSLAGGSSGAACFFVERFMRDWGDFLESSGGAGNEKDARQVSGGAFFECADQLARF